MTECERRLIQMGTCGEWPGAVTIGRLRRLCGHDFTRRQIRYALGELVTANCVRPGEFVMGDAGWSKSYLWVGGVQLELPFEWEGCDCG